MNKKRRNAAMNILQETEKMTTENFGNRLYSAYVRSILGIVLISLLGTLAACSNKPSKGSKAESIGLEWIPIKGGTYQMGSFENAGKVFEYPRHEEKVKSFDMLKSEVTVSQYKACIKDGACWETLEMHASCNFLQKNAENQPINCIDWYQAHTFCLWAGGRLPTEVEWEFAARSRGKDIEYPWGNEPPDCSRAALDADNSINCGKWKGGTSPVCSRPKGNSEQGICDLIGNVHEWTVDWFYPSYEREKYKTVPMMTNGKTEERTQMKTMRGGGIGSDVGQGARRRVLHDPPFQYLGLGVRCVRSK